VWKNINAHDFHKESINPREIFTLTHDNFIAQDGKLDSHNTM